MMTPFTAIQITEKVYWVGAIDLELRNLHGYHTPLGTTYNAYLIMGEKPVLIDTVKAEFASEMMSRIRSVIDPEKISYIISNHAEMDHSGALPEAIATIKPEKVFASKMGVKALQEHFQLDFPITAIESDATLEFGDLKFTCIETKMLHWPDSMFTYFVNEGVLFSQDGFGMHLAFDHIFADQNSRETLAYEAAKYFANILLPFAPFVIKALKHVDSLNLDIKMIAPDHGPVWRTPEDIQFILNKWAEWGEQKSYNKAVIIYDTMWSSTAKMAASIADGLMEEHCNVKVMPIDVSHRSDIMVEILEAGALIVGSPTLNKQMFPTLADILSYVKGLKPQNLLGQAFGSYGWSGEAVGLAQKELEDMQIKLIEEPIKIKYVPTTEDLAKCHLLGKQIAQDLKTTNKQGEL